MKVMIDEIGKEMAVQDNRATQYPLFVVISDIERAVPDGCGESKRKDLDAIDSDLLCEDCSKKYNEDKDLPEHCIYCDDDCFWNCEVSQEPDLRAGVFFTAKACQEHIDLNSYHYKNPKVYGIGAWRNPEMVAVMSDLIMNHAGKELPSHYR